MTKYLTLTELSEEAGIPLATTRRWIDEFEDFIISKIVGSRVVYHPRTARKLRWVKGKRDEGLGIAEIRSLWAIKLTELAEEQDRIISKLNSDASKRKRESKSEENCVVKEYKELKRSYLDLVNRVHNASLWQRITKTW